MTFLGFAKVRIILISLFSPHVGGGGGGGGGGTTADRVDNGLYLGVYGGMCLAVVLVEVARDCALFLSAAEASRTIHRSDLAGNIIMQKWELKVRHFRELLDGVSHSPMSFFDTNPVGRVVNRFATHDLT